MIDPSNASQCLICEAGTFNQPGVLDQEMCELCPRGYFQDLRGMTACRAARQDRYAPFLGMAMDLDCPAEMGSPSASDELTDCRCDPSWFHLSDSECLGCDPICVRCPLKGTIIPVPQAGHWVNAVTPTDQWECWPEDACLAAQDEADVLDGTCAPGYAGRKCQECAEGYYRFGVECRPCGSKAYRWSLWTFFIVVALSMPLVVLLANMDKYLDQIHVMVGYLQIMGALTLLQGFSDETVQVLKFISVFSLNFDAMEPSCAGVTDRQDFPEKFVASFLIPIAFLAYLVLVFIVAALFGWRRRYASSVDTFFFDEDGEPLYFLNEVIEQILSRFFIALFPRTAVDSVGAWMQLYKTPNRLVVLQEKDFEGMDEDLNVMRHHAQMMLDRAVFRKEFRRGFADAGSHVQIRRMGMALRGEHLVGEDVDKVQGRIKHRGGLVHWAQLLLLGVPLPKVQGDLVLYGEDIVAERYAQATHLARALPTQAALEGQENKPQTRTIKLLTNALLESILIPARLSDLFRGGFFLFWRWSILPLLLWYISVWDCARSYDCAGGERSFLERDPGLVCFFMGNIDNAPDDGFDRTTWRWLAAFSTLGMFFWVVGWLVAVGLVLYWLRPTGDKPLIGAVDRARAEGNMGLHQKLTNSTTHIQWNSLFRCVAYLATDWPLMTRDTLSEKTWHVCHLFGSASRDWKYPDKAPCIRSCSMFDEDKYWWEVVEWTQKVLLAVAFVLPMNLSYLAAMLVQLGGWVLTMLHKPHQNNQVSVMQGWCDGTIFIVLFLGFLSYIKVSVAFCPSLLFGLQCRAPVCLGVAHHTEAALGPGPISPCFAQCRRPKGTRSTSGTRSWRRSSSPSRWHSSS